MKRSNIIALILIIIFLAGVGGSIFRATRQGNTIQFNSRTLTPSLWGAAPGEKLTCKVYLNKDHTFGWTWSRLDPMKNPRDNFVRPIFPNVRIGADLGEQTNNKYFPLKSADVQSLKFNVDYRYLTSPTGDFNLAYQMYFTDTDKPAAGTIPKIEVMIWLHHTYPQPPDTYKGDLSDGINTYELWSWVMPDGRQYYSFLMKGLPVSDASHAVDAKKLLDSINIDPGLFLLGVHFGNEVVDGAGKIEIGTLTVNLNGIQI